MTGAIRLDDDGLLGPLRRNYRIGGVPQAQCVHARRGEPVPKGVYGDPNCLQEW